MYKIVTLLIKYVKLAILNEILSVVRADYMRALQTICKEMNDETRGYYQGQVFVTSKYAREIERRIREIKKGPVKNVQTPGLY